MRMLLTIVSTYENKHIEIYNNCNDMNAFVHTMEKKLWLIFSKRIKNGEKTLVNLLYKRIHRECFGLQKQV